MPGAPNSPPKTAAPASPGPTDIERKVLRRLAPSRVALQLDLWKGAPARDLVDPFARAESLYETGDFRGSDSALDQLSVRFAEPRWPTLPEPFRGLRVRIPAPMPPHYDPEFTLPPEEKESRRQRREADLQLSLARASVDWAGSHQLVISDLTEPLQRAEAALLASGPSPPFWTDVDLVWSTLRSRVPAPTGPVRAAPAAPPASAAAAVASPDEP
ncbi:MAG: hypothetical protein L3J95_04505 [Thermoplasmata archaeon]|nr:hypothetical protein [Thermoplasmata archaeon]MCI4359667.1 hypothetical protein [Thermoplasmata archaeon]